MRTLSTILVMLTAYAVNYSVPVAASIVTSLETFFVTLATTDQPILIDQHGPLQLYATCELVSNQRQLTLSFKSTEANWATPQWGFNLPANSDRVVSTILETGQTPSTNVKHAGNSGHTAIAPDGSVLSFDAATTLVGMNLYDVDCLVAGFIFKISGEIPE